MLYWAEGSKEKNRLAFANSELSMVKLFKQFVVECFEVDPGRFALRVNAYVDQRPIEEIEHHWLDGLGLPPSCLRKPCVNHLPTSSSGGRPGKLENGVATLTVHRSMEIVQHVYGAIQEYAGFDQPQWVGRTERRARSDGMR